MKYLTWKQFGVLSLILCGLILAFAPVDKNSGNEFDPDKLAREIINREDHITAEQLGELIIDSDPNYILIDVRSKQEYEKYHIKTAYSFPLEKLFTRETLDLFDREKLIILYSNGGTHAAQAWVLLKQFGFENSLVLLGGLNYYVDVYSNPDPPDDVYADSEIFRYQFIKSAGSFLLGDQKLENDVSEQTDVPEIKIFKPKKRRPKADEGC